MGYENVNSQWDIINHSNWLVQNDWTKWLCVNVENKIIKTTKELITLFYVAREWDKDEIENDIQDVFVYYTSSPIYRVM